MKRRADGRYVKVKVINGKKIWFYSSAKDEKSAEKDFDNQLLAYKEKEEKGKLFKDVADEWEKEHFPTLAKQTEERYKSLKRYATDFFANDYIKDIEPCDIKRFLDTRIKKNFAQKTISHQLSVLNLIFKYACINRYITSNPCQYITVPNNLPKKKRRIPIESEIEIVKNSLDCTFGLFAYFLLYSGLRKGEALALKYGDIDFENKTINVTKSVFWESNKPDIKTPKTDAGTRMVILLDCLAEKISKGKTDKLLFPDEDGGLMRHSTFDKLWSRYQKETGLSITPHQLRHSYASYILYEAGIDVKTAQELMGHADASTTQNIYTQISLTRMEKTANKLNAFINNSKNSD